MSCRLITAPTFPLLERRLLADLEPRSEADPLSPQCVVVPSATLANHLRVRLARTASTTALAGIRVVNLPRFAQRLCAALLDQSAPRWGPALDLLLLELVAKLPGQSALAKLKSLPGGGALLRETFSDLAEGGFGFGELETVKELANEPDLTAREQETLRLYARWLELVRDRGIEWSPLTLAALPEQIEEAGDEQLRTTLGCEQGQDARLFLHGFYEWTDVHLQWIAALAKRIPTTIYFPSKKNHPAFAFARSVLDDLKTRLGTVEEESAEIATEKVGEFFLRTFPEGDIGKRPGFLTHQSASGVRAEVVSAAVRIREWLDDTAQPVQPEDILVVAPQAEQYVEAVQEVFAAFAIPVRLAGVSAGPTPEQEPLRILARICDEQAPAEWVLALLRSSPDIPAARGVDIEHFEERVRELGVWGGSAWRAARELAGWSDAEKKLLDEIAGFVAADGSLPAPRLAAADAHAELKRIRDRWLTEATLLEPLIDALESAQKAAGSLAIDRSELSRLLAESGGAQNLRDPLTRGVLFVPLMRARGLTARRVVILGLAAGQLPFRVQDDPLLSEPSAARLAHAAAEIGHRLPIKARVTEEQALLFFLVNTAAEQVHWVVPETDAAGKAVAPTPWVQRYVQRWIPAMGAEPPMEFRRISRAPFEQAMYLAQREPGRGSLLAPAFALYVQPELAAGLDGAASMRELLAGVANRGRTPEWSGCIGTKEYPRRKIAVTKLESLAKCPFRFYAESVAKWEPLESLSITHDLDALARGSLVHDLLAHIVQPHRGKKEMGAIAKEMLAGNGRALRAALTDLINRKAEARAVLAMLPPVFRQAALDGVLELAAAYLVWAQEQKAIPQDVEKSLEKPYPGLGEVLVAGKVDRIDEENGRFRLLDFKSGRQPDSYAKLVKLGWQVQAVLYPWLTGHLDGEFSYVFLGDDEKKRVGDAKEAPAAETFLGELAPVLKQGVYIPTSNQVMQELGLEKISPCRYCHCVSACRRFEPRAARLHAQMFQKLLPQRAASIATAAAPKESKESKVPKKPKMRK